MGLNLAIKLLDNEILSRDQFIEVVRQFESSRPSEMSVALRNNMISTLHARRILECQVENPEMTFSEAAQQEGILCESECQMLDLLQDASRQTVSEILVEKEICTPAQVNLLHRSLRVCDEKSSKLPTPKFSRRQRNVEVETWS